MPTLRRIKKEFVTRGWLVQSYRADTGSEYIHARWYGQHVVVRISNHKQPAGMKAKPVQFDFHPESGLTIRDLCRFLDKKGK